MGRGSFSADKEVPLALLDTDVPPCQKTGMAQARQIIPLENVKRVPTSSVATMSCWILIWLSSTASPPAD